MSGIGSPDSLSGWLLDRCGLRPLHERAPQWQQAARTVLGRAYFAMGSVPALWRWMSSICATRRLVQVTLECMESAE